MDQYFFPDIKFITDEKFDFGLSSLSDSREEEHVEEEELRDVDRGVAQRLDPNVQQREGAGRSRECLARWSPLSPEKLEEIVKEANRLAVQLERCSLQEKENASTGALGPRASPRSPRRETFVVKNSPVRALLPTVDPSPCARAAPTPPHLRHKLGSCSTGGERLRKKSTPSKGPALSPTKRPQSSKKVDGPLRGGGAEGPAWGRAKASRDDVPWLPASSRPARSAHTHQTQARSTAAPGPTSCHLVPSGIPKPASRSVLLSRAAVPGRPSQPQPVGHGSAGRRVLPSAAGQRGESPKGASRAHRSPLGWGWDWDGPVGSSCVLLMLGWDWV
uniref:Proline and serine rich coiled-coil 1 n=1 Tax=Chelonoidis abingdonii TaxID=106734 RepID=A0A8C0HG93_CHEAB